jgi:hypothetical protein
MNSMNAHRLVALLAGTALLGACAARTSPHATTPVPSAATGTIARIYYWRAMPGKVDEYTRYVREVAEQIDAEAQRAGAFISLTTFVAKDPASPWTHMRVFVLRDSAQLAGLSAALDEAGKRFEPDSVKRRLRSEYSSTLRQRVGDATVDILR